MTAKIEWYREVLELEPNSKVFFPLARLLAEAGQAEEAVTLLQNGLERHPEYLEARLFLIELLFKGGQREACDVEVGKLSKMFASYAGFWQAWAACLASDGSQEDTASIIRLLAAHFVSGPLKLSEVLNRGLDAMIRDGSAPAMDAQMVRQLAARQLDETKAGLESSKTPDADKAPDVVEEIVQAAEGPAAFAANTDAMLEDLDSELEPDELPEIQPVASPEEPAITTENPDVGMAPAEETALESAPEPEPAEAESQAAAAEEPAIAVADPDASVLPAEEPAAAAKSASISDFAQAVDEIAAQAELELAADQAEPQLELEEAEPARQENLPAAEQDAGMLPAEEAPLQVPPYDNEEDPVLSPEGWAEVAAAEAARVGSGTEPEAPAQSQSEEQERQLQEARQILPEPQTQPETQPEEQLPLAEPRAAASEPPFVEAVEPGAREVAEVASDAALADEAAESALADTEALPEEPQPEAAPEAVAQAEADMLAAMELPEMAEPVQEADAASEPVVGAEVVAEAPREPQPVAEAEEIEAVASGESLPGAEEVAATVQKAAAQAVQADQADLDADFEEEEESFSLRTRSMAEVLAEQGDIQGALDIYQELAAAATSADEVEDISRRMATLSARLKMTNASAGFREDADAAARSKEKLIGMLEALAERVEARAQG